MKDQLNGAIKEKHLRDSINSFLKYYGSYKVDTVDIAYLNMSHEKQLYILNKQIDSLKQVINSKTMYTFEIDGRSMSANQWVDTLYNYYEILDRKLRSIRVTYANDTLYRPLINYIDKDYPKLK